MPNQTRTKKSPGKMVKTEEESNRGNNKRGRPRVESHDQSAVERRRTQIRLAQRAYRERKETTISALETQVNQLKQVIQEMNKTFSEYSDRMIASGFTSMQPALGDDLRSTMKRMNELHQEFDIEDDDMSATFSARSTNSRQSSVSQTKPMTSPTNIIHTSKYAEPPMVDSRYGIEDASIGMLGYQVDYESSPTTNSIHDPAMTQQSHGWSDTWSLAQNPPTYSYTTVQQSPMSSGPISAGSMSSGPMNSAPINPAPINPAPINSGSTISGPMSSGSWEIYIPRELKGASTYCWQETSFARRLLRHSHERCLYLLSNPIVKANPGKNRASYSLSFMTKDALAAKMRRTMLKTNSEPLEDWTMPMLHVGGAGLHYDRDPTETVPPTGFTAERNTGPFQLPSAAIQVPAIYFPDKVATWLGLEGKWFDNRDVEVYLRTKGIDVDGRSSTTVVEIEDVPELSSSSSTRSSNDDFETAGASIPGIGRVIAPQDQALFNEFDKLINSVPSRRRKVELSLDKLVYELNERCFCLGRAPGYKQSDVDEIYQQLISEAWEYSENAEVQGIPPRNVMMYR